MPAAPPRGRSRGFAAIGMPDLPGRRRPVFERRIVTVRPSPVKITSAHVEPHQFARAGRRRKAHQQQGAIRGCQQPGRELAPAWRARRRSARGRLPCLGGAFGAADAGDQGAHGGAVGGGLVAGELVGLADGAALTPPPRIRGKRSVSDCSRARRGGNALSGANAESWRKRPAGLPLLLAAVRGIRCYSPDSIPQSLSVPPHARSGIRARNPSPVLRARRPPPA